MSNVRDVQFGSGEIPPPESARLHQSLLRLCGNDLRRLCTTVVQVSSDERFVVHQLLFTVFEFFKSAENMCVAAMKRLLPK
ncbi:MAG TPA: hypothetical protein EYG57_08795 [Planctomycetes bacterium]|nr:hypothetical protein [Planctomycetota bacterium]